MIQTRFPFGDLWSDMGRLHTELNRLFHRSNGRAVQPVGPAFNVWEDDHNIFAEVDLPGIDTAKLEVLVTEGNQLTVQGERAMPDADNAVWHRQERGFGQFVRQLALPAMVDADKVEARYENGVLHLTLPKSETAKPKKIAVRAG